MQMEERHPVITESERFPEEEEGRDEDPIAAHSSVCDRRLSRAARSLLHRHLTAILAFKDDNNPSVWQLLEDSLAPRAYQENSQCPLIPSRDLLRYQEENSIVLKPPPKKANTRLGLSTRNALYQLTKRNWLATPFYQCGFCGKMFSSRYYLDQHLDQHHSHQVVQTTLHSKSTPDNLICPATSYCPALPSCAQQALEDEPYYGPGSGGLSPDDKSHIHRSLAEDLEACDEAVMKDTQRRCFQMMEACFDKDSSPVRTYLETSLCARINCPDRLHQLFFASNQAAFQMRKQVHEWQDEWEAYYEEHHTLGRMGMFLLFMLAMGYLKSLWRALSGSPATKALQKKDPKGSRLLSKKGASSSLWKSAKKSLGMNSSKAKTKAKVH